MKPRKTIEDIRQDFREEMELTALHHPKGLDAPDEVPNPE